MSATETKYRIVSRVHVNQWSNELQQAVPGWDIRALWVKTGTMLPIFVPDASYTAENVDTLIRIAGAKDEQIHELGG
jgi:hypothetical protein